MTTDGVLYQMAETTYHICFCIARAKIQQTCVTSMNPNGTINEKICNSFEIFKFYSFQHQTLTIPILSTTKTVIISNKYHYESY